MLPHGAKKLDRGPHMSLSLPLTLTFLESSGGLGESTRTRLAMCVTSVFVSKPRKPPTNARVHARTPQLQTTRAWRLRLSGRDSFPLVAVSLVNGSMAKTELDWCETIRKQEAKEPDFQTLHGGRLSGSPRAGVWLSIRRICVRPSPGPRGIRLFGRGRSSFTPSARRVVL